MILLCALLLGFPAIAGTLPPRGAALFDTELAAGNYWGLPIREAAGRLGVEASSGKPGLGPEWFIESALKKLWLLETADGFARIEISSGSWLFSRYGKIFGHMARVPATDQETYGALARKRFGKSRIIHLEALPPPGTSDLNHFLHCVRWSGEKTNFVLFTATPKLQTRRWTDPETGTAMRVELLYKAKDPDVPLYLVFWDGKAL